MSATRKVFLSVLLLSWVTLAAHAQTVYITRTGAKYHQGDCRYLHSSKISTTLAEAKKMYTACSVCRPPSVVEERDEAGSSQVTQSGSGGVKPESIKRKAESIKLKAKD